MASSVLIVDDEESIAWTLRRAFEKAGYAVAVAATAEEGIPLATANNPNAIFLDVRLPGMDGLTALGQFRAASPHASVVVMTAHGNLATAVKAVEGGAFDYLAKPFDLDQALDTAARATARATTPNGASDSVPPTEIDSGEILGRSPAMQTLFKRIALVAPTDACVFITGESGTGKELVARAIHRHGPRRDRPFLPVHVAALNPNLVESELFGHVRGSFTGADRNRDGLLALANGGTVFLDEIADISLDVQAKLLRVLERQEVMPVGGAVAQSVNVRIISATHVDLGAAIAAGKFRHDLFYRLNIFPIHVPALRERTGDIPMLAAAFLAQCSPNASLTREALAELHGHTWHGNVRELRNAIERAAIEARGGPVRAEHLSLGADGFVRPTLDARLESAVREWTLARTAAGESSDLYNQLLNRIEPVLLAEVLRQLDGNRLATGRRLGLARATVRKLIRKYGLAPETESDQESVD